MSVAKRLNATTWRRRRPSAGCVSGVRRPHFVHPTQHINFTTAGLKDHPAVVESISPASSRRRRQAQGSGGHASVFDVVRVQRSDAGGTAASRRRRQAQAVERRAVSSWSSWCWPGGVSARRDGET